jgi:hypothetical protein
MNVLLRWLSSSLAVHLGAVCLAVGVASPLCAQSLPTNPLRGSAPRVIESPSMPQASPAEPVQLAAHADMAAVSDTADSVPAVRTRRTAAKPAAYASSARGPRRDVGGFVPRHELVAPAQITEELPIEPTPMEMPGEVTLGPMGMDPSLTLPDATLGGDCCGAPVMADCGGCGSGSACGGCGTCVSCCLPCPLFLLDNVELFAGTQAFSGPLNLGETGSFGFQYGLNWAMPVPCLPSQPIGFQIGYRGVSSNYSGASFTEDSRNQSFITAGLFRRVDWGLQGGVVIDVLSDKWYYDDLSLTQLRGELSWVFPQCHELGAFITSGTKTNRMASVRWNNDAQRTTIEEYEPTDLVAFFYRRRFDAVGGGYGRAYGGFTGNGGGLVGADFDLPLTENWALRTNFNYLIPKDGNNRVAYLDESWNVGLSVVWYPGRRKAVGNDYFRPLFDVADNGVFIPRRSE